jgi:hypothetical protein
MRTNILLMFMALLRAILAIIMINAPFWWMEQSHISNRPLFNVDAILVLSLMVFRPLIGSCLLVFAWMFDAIVAKSLIYHFKSPLDLIASARFAYEVDWMSFLYSGDTYSIFLFLFILMLLPSIIWRKRLVLPFFLAIILSVAAIDVYNGTSRLSSSDQRRFPINVAGSPLLTLSLNVMDQAAFSPLRSLHKKEIGFSISDVQAWASRNPSGGILLVVVESLGAPVEPALQEWLDRRMYSKSHQIQKYEAPFNGSTTYAELRILCGLYGHYSSMTAAEGTSCLPAQLSRLGWSTNGIHGFSARFFNRKVWWPLVGLEQLTFMDSPLLVKESMCGSAFYGVCDKEVLNYAGRWLNSGERRFAYVLTLNTHLPLDEGTVPQELEQICKTKMVDFHACRLVAELGKVLDEIILVLENSQTPILALVVGDHAPPFNSLASRSVFSQEVTPAYLLHPNYSH